MTTQAHRPSRTQATPPASAQANHDASIRPVIKIDEVIPSNSSQVSAPAVSDSPPDPNTSGDDADRSATPSPPSEQDYAVNMLRSAVIHEWNDSGNDDEDSLPGEISSLERSQRRPSSPFQPVDSDNQRHQHSSPTRVRHSSSENAEDEESVFNSDTASGLRGGGFEYMDTNRPVQVCHHIGLQT